MRQLYDTTATTTVTPRPWFNPFLPAIGRLLEVLLSYGPPGTVIHTDNRDLAEAVGLRSAGHIPTMLRTLEAKGYIERVTTPQGSLIVVKPDLLIPCEDQPSTASQSDPCRDQMDVTEMRDQHADVAEPLIPHADPPLHPPIRNHDSSQQQQRDSHARESGFAERQTRDPGSPDRVFPHEWRQILAANPGYTRRDFERELALAEARPDLKTTPVQLVVGVRRRGEIVYSATELYARQEGADHGRQSTPHSQERPAAARPNTQRWRGDRRHADRPGTAGGGAGGAVDYDALLAEIDAAGPVELRL